MSRDVNLRGESRKMPQRIIGIDIGNYSVKVAVIDRSFKSFAFTEFFERRIQYNELLTPEESVSIAIQGLIDDHNLSWDIAAVNFPSNRVTTRLLTFPFGATKKIDQTIQFEIESYIPFSMEDVLLDYIVVRRTKDSSRVMVVYVQKKEVAKELAMLASVSVDPRFLCIEGIELAELVNLGMVPPEGAFAIIDFGHEKSTVTICHGKSLGYIRAISLAGKAITASIAERLNVPVEEAERIKIEMGRLSLAGEEEMVDEITRGTTAAIRTVMDEFLLHLKQTFFAFRETEGIPVEGIYLCGGTSRIPGLERYISDALKLNVTFLNCADFHFTRMDRADAHRHVVPQALGLAVRGAAGGGLDVNLRQDEFAYKGDVEELGGSVRRIGIVIGLIIFLSLISFTSKYYSVKRQIDKMHGDIVALVRQALPGTPVRAMNTPKTAMSLIKSKENEVGEKMTQLKGMMGISPMDILKEVSTVLPPRAEFKVDIAELNIVGDRITMSGSVGDFKTVDAFKQVLEKSSMFANITTGDVNKGVKGEVKFKLSMDTAAPKEQ